MRIKVQTPQYGKDKHLQFTMQKLQSGAVHRLRDVNDPLSHGTCPVFPHTLHTAPYKFRP